MIFFEQINNIASDFLSKIDDIEFNRERAKRDPEYLFYCFFLLRKRRIQPKYYNVFESKEFLANSNFGLIQNEYYTLKGKLTSKSDLSSYYTKTSNNLDKIDVLLEDWNINHFHLNGGDFQLYFMIFNDCVFILNLYKHFSKNSFDYAKKEFIEIIEKNWPNFLYKINGVKDVEIEIDKSSRTALRKASWNSPVKTNNGIYLAIGDGISSAHTSLWATRMVDKLYDWVIDVDKLLKNDTTISEIAQKLGAEKSQLNFEIILLKNEAFCLLESISRKVILVGDKDYNYFRL